MAGKRIYYWERSENCLLRGLESDQPIDFRDENVVS